MLTTSIRFVTLLLTSLLVGSMFGVWLGFNPAPLSPSAFVEMQQNAIRALNVSLPALGLICIALTVVLAWRTRTDGTARYLLFAAAACLLAAGLLTRFGNQPINALVMTWSPQSPPANWTELRDTWWRFHVLRTLAGVTGLALSLAACLRVRETAA
jgi:hypothetical protein